MSNIIYILEMSSKSIVVVRAPIDESDGIQKIDVSKLQYGVLKDPVFTNTILTQVGINKTIDQVLDTTTSNIIPMSEKTSKPKPEYKTTALVEVSESSVPPSSSVSDSSLNSNTDFAMNILANDDEPDDVKQMAKEVIENQKKLDDALAAASTTDPLIQELISKQTDLVNNLKLKEKPSPPPGPSPNQQAAEAEKARLAAAAEAEQARLAAAEAEQARLAAAEAEQARLAAAEAPRPPSPSTLDNSVENKPENQRRYAFLGDIGKTPVLNKTADRSSSNTTAKPQTVFDTMVERAKNIRVQVNPENNDNDNEWKGGKTRSRKQDMRKNKTRKSKNQEKTRRRKDKKDRRRRTFRR